MDIRTQEDNLFEVWREKYEAFVSDGAPNPEALMASDIRTVIVLKDINAPDIGGDFPLRERLATKPHPWWKKVVPWCAGISNLRQSLSWQELKEMPLKDSLAPYAFMQLKKTPGGGSIGAKTLARYAEEDAEEIRTQLEIYRPRLIIGAGSRVASNIANHAFGGSDWRRTHRGIRYSEVTMTDGQISYVIDYIHPSARVKRNVVCYGLLDAVREIVGKEVDDGR